jgi:L-ascorbate metabolism protein UlaG (beta-lactamase superfamily)
MCLGTFATAQDKAITIRFIGNCGLYLTDGSLDVYTDFPYKSGAFGYMKYPASELDSIRPNATHLFTHRHPDHYQKKLVKLLSGTEYGPWKVAKKRKADLSLPQYAAADFSVEAFKTKHRFAHHHYSYLITWHGKRIYINGDAEARRPSSNKIPWTSPLCPFGSCRKRKSRTLRSRATGSRCTISTRTTK